MQTIENSLPRSVMVATHSSGLITSNSGESGAHQFLTCTLASYENIFSTVIEIGDLKFKADYFIEIERYLIFSFRNRCLAEKLINIKPTTLDLRSYVSIIYDYHRRNIKGCPHDDKFTPRYNGKNLSTVSYVGTKLYPTTNLPQSHLDSTEECFFYVNTMHPINGINFNTLVPKSKNQLEVDLLQHLAIQPNHESRFETMSEKRHQNVNPILEGLLYRITSLSSFVREYLDRFDYLSKQDDLVKGYTQNKMFSLSEIVIK